MNVQIVEVDQAPLHIGRKLEVPHTLGAYTYQGTVTIYVSPEQKAIMNWRKAVRS